MSMKEPKGKALKIAGTVSAPSDVDNYTKIQNGTTVPKNITSGDPRGSAMPKIKPSGDAKTY